MQLNVTRGRVAGYLYQALQHSTSEDGTADPAPPHLTSVAFSPDSALLAAGSMAGCALIWQWREGELVKAARGHEGAVLGVVWLQV